MKNFFRNLSHVQIIAFGFLLLILTGSFLLMLPISTTSDQPISFADALFTATSATCVTGLVTVDTASWTFFGQCVILFLIQIGGLGFMTIASVFFVLFRKKMGLRSREVMSESINSSGIGSILKISKNIVIGTLFFEGVGACILFFRALCYYKFSLADALWFGVFHAVSSFCNAGFDINGSFSSFTAFSSDWLVCSVLMLEIIIGGIGFFVWEDVRKNKFSMRRYSLHSKIVLAVTAFLIFIPTFLFFFLEKDFSHSDLTFFLNRYWPVSLTPFLPERQV